MLHPKVVVVTALWYEDRFLPALFASLEKTNYPRENWEIIMIDNKSSAVTREWIEKNVTPKAGQSLPVFHLIKTDVNLGFAGGNNACIKLAMEHGCEAVYLLNEDAHGEPEFLSKAIEKMESLPTIGAVQSLLVLQDAADRDETAPGSTSRGLPSRINSIGNCLHFLGLSYCGGQGMSTADAKGLLRVRKLHDEHLNIASASGAGVLLRVEALKKVGLFDEGYHLYHEDVDLSLRLRHAGYRIVIEPSSVVHHRYEFARSAEKYYWMERNRFRLLLEHWKWPTLIVLLPGLIASELGLIAFGIMNGTLKDRLRAYGYIINPKNWPEIWKKRQTVQKLRTVPDEELMALCVSDISFQSAESAAVKIVNPLMSAYWAVARRIIFW